MVGLRDLMNLLHYNEEDLEYNRQGKISPRQSVRLQRRATFERMLRGTMYVLTGLMLVAGVVAALVTHSLISLLIFVLIAIFTGLAGAEVGSPIRVSDHVLKAQGRSGVYAQRDPETGGTDYYLLVNDYKFEINKAAYLLLEERTLPELKVYFAEIARIRVLLSLEAPTTTAF